MHTPKAPLPRDDRDNPTFNHPSSRPADDDPWPVDVTGHDTPPCSCPPPPEKRPKPPCTRSRPKDKECCETILEMLAPLVPYREGTSRRTIHKRKTPPKVKLANWCCDWPVPDAIAPIMVLLFERE